MKPPYRYLPTECVSISHILYPALHTAPSDKRTEILIAVTEINKLIAVTEINKQNKIRITRARAEQYHTIRTVTVHELHTTSVTTKRISSPPTSSTTPN